MNERTCIVTRQSGAPDDLIRFVVGPDSALVPDLKRNLPGRGCWVTADRLHVERAAAKKLFARALKAEIQVPADLGDMVDRLLARSALGSIGLARKAGAVALGAAKVEAACRSGEALAVLHAGEASPDGVRKIMPGAPCDRPSGRPRNPRLQTFFGGRIGFGIGGRKCDTCCRSRAGRGQGGAEAHSCARPLPGRHPG